MALFLSRFSYTTEAKKALLNQPQERSGAAREMEESLGGKLLGFGTPSASLTESF